MARAMWMPGQQGGEEPLSLDPELAEEGLGGNVGHRRHRPVRRGDPGRVGHLEAAQAAEHDVAGERSDAAQQQGDGDRGGDGVHGRLAQLDAALESERQQEVDAEPDVDVLRQRELAAHQPGHHAQGERQGDGREKIGDEEIGHVHPQPGRPIEAWRRGALPIGAARLAPGASDRQRWALV
jgi:hypothetical protein